MTTSELPPALRPWSESLAFLTVEAAVHIGPLVRRLDALVRRHDANAAGQGEPDGYGGLTTRGHPERLLLSEWLLAEELPLEFMRKAAQRELLHINPVYRSAQPEGRVAVFCDVGPDQLGAARLVQLAALIVLHRRALTRQTELVLGVSGARPELWHGGELPEIYTVWRRSREPSTPQREELTERQATLDDKDELWVLAGDSLAHHTDAPLLLHTRETGWDEQSVTTVEVRFEGRGTTLAVPPGPVSVQALRGAALRRQFVGASARPAGEVLRGPTFPSHDRRLLMRGDQPEHVLVVSVPASPSGGARPKLYRFKGPVVAATSYAGTRLVALVMHGDRLRAEVIGKKLAHVDTVDVPLSAFGLTPATVDLEALAPLHFDRGELLWPFAGEWWRLPERGQAPYVDEGVIAVGPSEDLDQPGRARLVGERLMLNYDRTVAEHVDRRTLVAIAGDRWLAWNDGGVWQIKGKGFEPTVFAAPPDVMVLGAVVRHDNRTRPALVYCEDDHWYLEDAADRVHLVNCDGAAIGHALHSRLGVMAIQRDQQSVEMIDLATGEKLIEVHVG